jgi:hypothetical protein
MVKYIFEQTINNLYQSLIDNKTEIHPIEKLLQAKLWDKKRVLHYLTR